MTCDYSCSQKCHMNQHIASVNEGKKPIKCKATFTQKMSLKTHQNKHL